MSTAPPLTSDRPGEYVVVARRYRPQTFEELVGQQHVAQALAGAIASQRVGHAYLFTGARGVGKTSAARILAKALNCVHGPTSTPCNQCDLCQAISSGDDVDVLEIDGASNRGIDEMRSLRQNVNVRPSRSRFKIYIIDEVHMLTKEAFNALLKTLEEPPEHVKFIFCTTEPEKIPITILSRCQRFDFAGIQTRSIAERLQQIVTAEAVEAEPAALEAIARRAAGSMRDSQSLLEQLLAFGGQKLTLDDVHRMLGTAGDRRLIELAGHLIERDVPAALADLDRALFEGVDVGPLLDQLLGYFRDVMIAAAGGPAELMLYSSPADQPAVAAAGKQLGLETVLAVMQILDHTLARLRYSSHGRILAELALVRICRLENLESISSLIGQLKEGAASAPNRSRQAAASQSGGNTRVGAGEQARVGERSPSAPQSEDVKKKSVSLAEPTEAPPPQTVERPIGRELDEASLTAVWPQVLAELGDLLAEMARSSEGVAISAPNRLVVRFRERYTSCKAFCERPENHAKLERAVSQAMGAAMRVEFVLVRDAPENAVEPPKRLVTPQQRLAEKSEHPLVRRAAELFGAYPVRVEEAEAVRS
ncbi:MAG TPA: DNA polymerase III subunit gamma/tau [Pirellulales bacterium]|nr:DNA polymerase III subunit gamma/tau [Pirellulales bacterium]